MSKSHLNECPSLSMLVHCSTSATRKIRNEHQSKDSQYNVDVILKYMMINPGPFPSTSSSSDVIPMHHQSPPLLNPVVYLVSGFRWSFYGLSDVSVGVSLSMTFLIMLTCFGLIWWIFKTGYRLKA
jgi:hypothetical protein